MNYTDQTAWRKIQAFLPPEYQLSEADLPAEEHWDWRGHDVHLDAYRNPGAPAKVILLHGVGTNGRQMTTILGNPLRKDGFEVVAIDMPIYGETVVRKGAVVSYDDWVQCGSDYVDYERTRDSRPVFLYGLSAGGMETYHVAAKNGNVRGIVGMTFLDQRLDIVRKGTVRNAFWGATAVPLTRLAVRLGLGAFRMKMSIPSKMNALVNDRACLRAMLADRTSAGNAVNMKFLLSYMTYAPEIEPEDFDVCPVLLTQPEADRWTPQRLADPTLDKIRKVPVRKTLLRNGSHYPIEKTALDDLHRNVLAFLRENLRKA